MITCEWMGRLGNNMFQIAMVYSLAEKYCDIAEFPEYDLFDLPKRKSPISVVYEQEDKTNAYIDIPYVKGMCIVGFFQRHEYFDNIKNKLIDSVFKVPVDWNPDTICVHVRRGDFIYDPINFPTQPVSYYMSCLESLDYKNKRVVFCSDDIGWCKDNFKFGEYRGSTSAISDIYFGANCESVVMSNSTFSFWMAYLSKHDRQIYFPLNWFSKKSGRDGYEICPKNWNGI